MSDTNKFTKTTDTLGIKVRFHDLRHTNDTLLLKRKTNPIIVQERLGHSNVSITLGIYTHVLPQMQEEAEKIDVIISKNKVVWKMFTN